ncbi:MAG: V-type ATP synthase subunit D [Victivallales bacterium]|nr:V-type ATP synthase subunit D [Victivallales bacterium]
MAKIKLTKNELKNQRDSLKRFERYLPTLQLKKQQLQLEVRQMREAINSLDVQMADVTKRSEQSIALFGGNDAPALDSLIKVVSWNVGTRNIAGTDVPIFESIEFEDAGYDLFTTPIWFDDAIDVVKSAIELGLRKRLLEEALQLLEQELRVVTQRVNLFEKVMIPNARENIRVINIYLGDQQTNSVGRSKIAKGKCAARDATIA